MLSESRAASANTPEETGGALRQGAGAPEGGATSQRPVAAGQCGAEFDERGLAAGVGEDANQVIVEGALEDVSVPRRVR